MFLRNRFETNDNINSRKLFQQNNEKIEYLELLLMSLFVF